MNLKQFINYATYFYNQKFLKYLLKYDQKYNNCVILKHRSLKRLKYKLFIFFQKLK